MFGVGETVFRMKNGIRNYAWGSYEGLSRFAGIDQPPDKPGAEAWMGSHPDLSSEILDRTGKPRRLSEYIHDQPISALGEEIFEEYGNLPFLFKVLSASMPLSIQVHPDKKKAKEGFERENRKGIPRTAPDRNYRDSNHKPELALAISPFRALCGFRPLDETARLLGPRLSTLLDFNPALGSETLKTLLSTTFRLREKERLNLEALATERARELSFSANPTEKDAGETILLCYSHYPHDPGALAPFFLQILTLEPGQALYVPAGVMHAYLSGTILEIMATSDNVIRGGLTQKHMDIDELLSVIDFNAQPASIEPSPEGCFQVWRTPAEEFCLRRFERDTAATASPGGGAPTILLCTQGSFTLRCPSPMNRSGKEGERLEINRGASAFVTASCGDFVAEGQGTLYIASPGRT
jgi:mannose-6-phosphate isomerase